MAGLLNDCILRRLNNQQDIAAVEQFWGCPVAGFSTFGELFGININQTLTAIFFFDVAQGQAFSDAFLDYFPAHYGNFQNYFTLVRLARVELLVEIRARAANQLTDRFADMANLSEEVEAMAVHARQERAQRKLKKQLQAITASLHEGVLLVDAEGRIIFANPSAGHLLEQPALPLLALDEVMKLIVHDEAVPFAQGPFRTVIESGASNFADDCFVALADGRRLNVAYTASALEDGGELRAVVISFRSIETLKEAQRQALQSSHLASIGQLAAGIAHEINTPIQYVGDNLHFIIDSFGDIAATLTALRRDQATAGANEAIEMMCAERAIDDLLEEVPLAASQSLDGIRHVAHIVKSMKEFSHPGTGVKVPTDINSQIRTTMTISRSEWREVAHVETDLADDLPSIPCFPTDINQLLLNLVVNAAQAIGAQKRASPGHIGITTRRLAGHVEIRISDDGPAFPKRSATGSSIPSSPPRKSARAPGKAWRSRATWSKANTAAPLRST
ncbi:PAS domain-containing protein [Oleomonas cavernae]|uniref:PAS domain-containing protein n=1 Tax=Oleomonas cavernae TaxID=2320859 RepID=A0A418WAI5_9PROT|nr:PAS domain-containing protein [Oleomonas cavernae]RJF86989.1 PAS domain-containing protein [Oleomonas cavernae]